jgi:hypothetical protein
LALRHNALDGLREETIAVAAIGCRDDPRTKKVIEQQIPGGIGGTLAGQATVVGLPGTRGDEGPGPLRLCFGHQELQLAGLVAAEGKAGLVVALDEEPRAAEQGGEPR